MLLPIWALTEPNFIEWRVGNLSIKLPHLAFGDAKKRIPRHLIFKDMTVSERRNPKVKEWNIQFDNLPNEGDLPSNNMYTQIQRAFRDFAGLPSTMFLKDGTRYVGIAKDPVFAEIDNCKVMIQFTFEVIMETFPKGVLIS